MTQQEIFTKVKNHMLTQNQKSIVGYSCKYRGPFGLMCAVGCLIPDELYSPNCEGRKLLSLPDNILEYLGEQNLDLLEALQVIHDIGVVKLWETKLRDLAIEHNLEF